MMNSTILETGRLILRQEGDLLLTASEMLGDDFVRAVNAILDIEKGNRLAVVGIGKSGHIGRKISATHASLGIPSFFMHATEAGHGDLGMLVSGDVVLAISQSGESDELVAILPSIKATGIKIIAITGSQSSTLAKSANIILSSHIDQECCPLGLAPMSSTTLMLGLGDALAASILKARNFTKAGFAKFHPFGALGRNLTTKVSDLMLFGDDIPAVQDSDTIMDAIIEMSRVGIGLVCVKAEEKMVGLFTDGDLRRALEKNCQLTDPIRVLELPSDFKSFVGHDLAADCLLAMTSYGFQSGPVFDDSNYLIGVINFRMILQAGVSI